MYCPQCGTESQSDQRYCRSCGANLKVIGKAVTLSEAIARSDRGPLPRIKEMIKGMKVEQMSDEISRALEQMNSELMRHSDPAEKLQALRPRKKERPKIEHRRENHVAHGMASLFSGVALMIFLYYLSGSLVLKLPPETLARMPFELEPVLRIVWLVGLIPALSGLGRIIGGFVMRPPPVVSIAAEAGPERSVAAAPTSPPLPGSISEHTTEILGADRQAPVHHNLRHKG